MIACATQGALQNVTGSEFCGDLLHRLVSAGVSAHRGSRHHLKVLCCGHGRQDFIVQTVREEGVCRIRAQVLKRQHGESQGACFRCRGRLLRVFSNRCLLRVTGPLVVPERPAAEQQEQREDRELGGADALLTAVAVVPREHKDNRQPDQRVLSARSAGADRASGRLR